MKSKGTSGFTLNEFCVAASVLLLIVGLAIPGILRRRNEAAAIATLRTVAASQRQYANACGGGSYAVNFSTLNHTLMTAEISPSDKVIQRNEPRRRDGYDFQLRLADNAVAGAPDCHGMPTHSAYVMTAHPVMFGISGVRSFAVRNESEIWQISEASAPTEPFASPAEPLR